MPPDAVWTRLAGQYSWNPQRNNPSTHCSEHALRHFHSFVFLRGENLSRQHEQRHVGAQSSRAAVRYRYQSKRRSTNSLSCPRTHVWAEVYSKNESIMVFCHFIFRKKSNQTTEISHQIIKRLLDNNWISYSGTLVIPSPAGICCIALWRVLRVPVHQWKVVKLLKNLCSVA